MGDVCCKRKIMYFGEKEKEKKWKKERKVGEHTEKKVVVKYICTMQYTI